MKTIYQKNYYSTLSINKYAQTLFCLAVKYEDDRNIKYAEQFYLSAIKLGHTEACCRLGFLYKNGKDEVAKDMRKSLHYFKLAGISRAFRGGKVNLVVGAKWR